MSYRLEKEPTGKNSIIIDGFDKGIAASPYQGISNIQNLDAAYYPGVAYVNYRRQASNLAGGTWFAGTHSVNVSGNSGWIFSAPSSTVMANPIAKAVSPAGLIYILDDTGQIFKQTAVNSSAFGELEGGTGRFGNGNKGLAYWNNYLVVFGDGLIEFCGLGTSDADVIQSNWNVENFDSFYPAGDVNVNGTPPQTTLIYAASFPINIGDPLTFTTTGTLPAPLVAGTVYYATSAAVSGGTFSISDTLGGANITFTTIGTGDQSLHHIPVLLPLGNIYDLIFDGVVGIGATTANISSYTLPNRTVENTWLLASGNYNIIDTNGNNILAVFTNYSKVVTFISPISQFITDRSVMQVQIVNPNAPTNKTWLSKVDGNLYFANGRFVGRILSVSQNIVFNPSNPYSYVVDYGATAILQPQDIIVDMTDLKGQLIIAGNQDIYPWDYVSPNVNASNPIGEQIVAITNLLNNIYVLAGQKGNIYVSNGYSSQLLYKIPDYIAGTIDPVWSYGDIMAHRSRLFFQLLAQNTSGANLLAGVFSLTVSPSMIGETASGLVMEAQNSYGLIPPVGSRQTGVLIDNSPSSNGQDSYYSGWSNGASAGGIDYNDTSLWQNFEPTIETDIIPIGTFFNKKTLGYVEFKTDRPLATGDQLRIYARTSLSDTYTLLGTTSTNQLSDYYQTNVFQYQWVQFKIQMSCASSASSFIPLREVRLHFD